MRYNTLTAHFISKGWMMHSLLQETTPEKGLAILYNDRPYDGKIDELLDGERFDTLRICTFVSNPKYFFKKTAAFERIELILGIEESLNAEKFLFDPSHTNELLSSLDKKTLRKIADGTIDIRFTQVGQTIHSKIYLLSHSK